MKKIIKKWYKKKYKIDKLKKNEKTLKLFDDVKKKIIISTFYKINITNKNKRNNIINTINIKNIKNIICEKYSSYYKIC